MDKIAILDYKNDEELRSFVNKYSVLSIEHIRIINFCKDRKSLDEVQKLIKRSYTQTHRIITRLVDHGLIKRIKDEHDNKTTYILSNKLITNQLPFTDNPIKE
ncbi:MAG: helix-turn-helix domain-containing protein [Candidatus Pacearchaeota archaeon]|jgi:DNA-binding MarR family transcriptional regulator